MSVEDRLYSLLMERNNHHTLPLLQVVAVYIISQLHLKSLFPEVILLLDSDDRLIRETTIWTLYSIDEAQTYHILERVDGVPPGLIIQFMREVVEKKLMLLTIEKMLALKNVPMFATSPDYVVSQVAAMVQEVHLKARDILFNQGDEGLAMYIVYQGAIGIYRDGRRIQDLGENEVFGEMALFNDEPRSASATALVDTLLLRLNKDVFNELVADYPEILRGITGVLLNRLRATTEELAITQAVVGG